MSHYNSHERDQPLATAPTTGKLEGNAASERPPGRVRGAVAGRAKAQAHLDRPGAGGDRERNRYAHCIVYIKLPPIVGR